jgi:hypothetical protein
MTKEQQSSIPLELCHSQFFVLRTPLLPIEELTAWSEALTASRACEPGSCSERANVAWKDDVQVLRGRLRSVIDRPEILHALYVASPSLQSGIEHWKRDPDSKKGLQAERALVRYFVRMAYRSTPFGLFSGFSTGRVSEQSETALQLKPRSMYRLCCRLDFDYLFALTAALQDDPALAMELRFWPNSSLHKIADAWHYTESRLAGIGRTHHLVKVESDSYLESVIERAQNGATVLELIAAVHAAPGDANPSEEEAKEYVLGLIKNEILVSTLLPLLTGIPPLDDIIKQLECLPSSTLAANSLRGIREQIKLLEQTGLNCAPRDYQAVTAQIEKLPAKLDLAKLYQVDMIKSVDEAVMGKTVIAEVITGVELLCRLGQTFELDELKSFHEAFSARYGRALVPLSEALDEEVGIGFGAAAKRADVLPLLAGLTLNQARVEGQPQGKFLEFHGRLLQQMLTCAQAGKDELELDISTLPQNETFAHKLPDAFCVMGTLVAASNTALQAGDFQFHMQGGSGPSGARMMGRFCHDDPEIEAGVRNHLQQEEAHDPDAIYAEVVDWERTLPPSPARLRNPVPGPVWGATRPAVAGKRLARRNRRQQHRTLFPAAGPPDNSASYECAWVHESPIVVDLSILMLPAVSARRSIPQFFLGTACRAESSAAGQGGTSDSFSSAMDAFYNGSRSHRQRRRKRTFSSRARVAVSAQFAQMGCASRGRQLSAGGLGECPKCRRVCSCIEARGEGYFGGNVSNT